MSDLFSTTPINPSRLVIFKKLKKNIQKYLLFHSIVYKIQGYL